MQRLGQRAEAELPVPARGHVPRKERALERPVHKDLPPRAARRTAWHRVDDRGRRDEPRLARSRSSPIVHAAKGWVQPALLHQ